MLRSLGSVLLGYVTFAVLVTATSVATMLAIEGKLPAESEPTRPLTVGISVLNLVTGWFFSVASGYVTAWVARRRELAHALALTGLMLVLGVFYLASRVRAEDRPEPLWYLVGLLVMPLISTPLGGILRARHVAARGLSA